MINNLTPLLIATNNPGKRIELQALLGDLPFQLLLPAEINLHMDVEENGQTYAENATLKAVAFCKASGLLTLADDSGLEVDALGGKPGIHSARFAPPEEGGGVIKHSDAYRRAYLLQQLSGHARPWSAHFHCTVVIATPAGDLHYADGDCPGEIIDNERGSNGFGYDPIFFLPELGRTMAEMSMEEKNRLSHRARAVIKAVEILKKIKIS